MRLHHKMWYVIQPTVVRETYASGLHDIRHYLKCDIEWDNETTYPNKHVDFIFHDKEDELFYKLIF